jgi:hypothetical protein
VSTREEIIAGYRQLLRFLAAHPEVPMRDSRLDGYCVLAIDDEAGMTELHRIAAALGVEVVERPGTNPCAERKFGVVSYEAFYVRRSVSAWYREMDRLGREAVEARPGGGSDA